MFLMDADPDGVRETCDIIAGAGGSSEAFVGDVSDLAAVEAAVATCLKRFGRLDLAHNNAGIVGTPESSIVDFSPTTFKRVLEVNVVGVFNCLRAQLPSMIAAGGGAIVNTASVVGRVAMPNISAYVTSKHAVVGLTKAAALENAAAGVRVNCVSPGYVVTNMTRSFFTPDTLAGFVAMHPIGRGAEPEEIADAVLYLLSDRAAFITGADLATDGGYTLS